MKPFSPAELERLVHALTDDLITPEEHRSLQALLVESEEARRQYLDLLDVHNLLEIYEEQTHCSPLEGPIPIETLLRKQRRRSAGRSLVTAIAALVVIGVFLHRVLVTGPAPTAIINVSDHSLFHISQAQNTGDPSAPNTMEPGSSFELAQGTVELLFDSGVRAVVQAPASLHLSSPDHLHVHEGRAWFHVPKNAVGFKVTSSQLHITDLGTEFGAVVDRGVISSQDEIHVFSGRVRVKALHGMKNSEILHAGEARSAHFLGRFSKIRASKLLFLTGLPPDLPHLHWSFNRPEGDAFPTTGDQPMVQGITSVPTQSQIVQVPGRKDMALSFTPGGGHLNTNWPGIDSDRPRTIACWIKSPSHQPTGSIVEWGIPASNSSKWRITLNPDHQGEGGRRGALRTEFGNGYVIGSTDLRDDQWHYIVSVYDGSCVGSEESVRLYVDGRLETISASQQNHIDTVLDDPRSRPCRIGAGFHGIIDELRIYQGKLPPEAIQNLYEQGSSK